MADNFQVNAASGGDVFAADDISGTKYPRLKLVHGADGTNDGDVSSANPLPVADASVLAALASVAVTGPLTDAELRASAVPVSDGGGSITVDGTFWQATQPVSLATVPSHDVTNAGTFAVQAAQSGTWNVGTVTAVTSITNAVTIQDGGGAITVDGTVGVSGTVTIDLGTNNDVTLAVLPDTAAGDLAAQTTDLAAIEVLLTTIEGNQLADGHNVTIDNASIAVTGTFWQATQPVSLASVPLPTGAATEATLTAIAGYIDTEIQAIVTAVQLLDNAISGSEFQVDIVSSALPTGAATEATLAQLNGKVTACNTGAVVISSGAVTANAGTNLNTSALALEGGGNLAAIATDAAAIEALLMTIDADTGAIATDAAAIEVLLGTIDADTSALAGTVSGSEVQVDIVASLPAGTNAIGKLAANSGVDIGDVDVTSIAAGTNTIGGVIAQASSSVAYDGTTACTVKRFHVAAPADGDSLIAAVADKKFRILSFGIISISGTICRFWLDDADAAAVFGNSTGIALEEDSGAASPGFILNHNPHGWFQTATANKALRIQFASGSGVVVFGTYIEVA